MCVVSNMIDYHKDWWHPGPWPPPNAVPMKISVPEWVPPTTTTIDVTWSPPYTGPTKEQFQEFLELLKAGKKYDKATGQPDCELAEKKKLVMELAKKLGIPLPDNLWS